MHLLVPSQQRNTRSQRRSNVFIANPEHNSHIFLVLLLLTLNRKMFTGIVSSQPAMTCSKLTIETLQQGLKYVQS